MRSLDDSDVEVSACHDLRKGNADKVTIRSIVDRSKIAGTVALYFEPEQLLHTNTALETTNSGFVVGPGAGQYNQVNY